MWEPDKPDIYIGGVFYIREPRPDTFQMRVRSILIIGESNNGKQWLCSKEKIGTNENIESNWIINKRSKLLRKLWPPKPFRVYNLEGMSQITWLEANRDRLKAHVRQIINFSGSFEDIMDIAKLTGYKKNTIAE